MDHIRWPCNLFGSVAVESLLHTNWWALFLLLAFALCPRPVVCTQCYPQSCGNVRIQYPFSITESCGLNSHYFQLDCRSNSSLGLGEFPYLSTGNGSYQVLEIFNDSLLLNLTDSKASLVATPVDWMLPQTCNVSASAGYASFQLLPYPAPFAISGDNSFGSFNCTVGVFYTDFDLFHEDYYVSENGDFNVQTGGCVSNCRSEPGNADCGRNRSCCVAPVAEDVRSVFYVVAAYETAKPCAGYSIPFYMDNNYTDFETTFAFKLSWALPYNKSSTDTDAIKNDPHYACARNSNFTFQSAVP